MRNALLIFKMCVGLDGRATTFPNKLYEYMYYIKYSHTTDTPHYLGASNSVPSCEFARSADCISKFWSIFSHAHFVQVKTEQDNVAARIV